jgi:hypothetical protein
MGWPNPVQRANHFKLDRSLNFSTLRIDTAFAIAIETDVSIVAEQSDNA